jgi:hypothetical protein
MGHQPIETTGENPTKNRALRKHCEESAEHGACASTGGFDRNASAVTIGKSTGDMKPAFPKLLLPGMPGLYVVS